MQTVTRRAWIAVAAVVLALVAAVAVGTWFWSELVDYINPRDATGRKDAVQVYTLIWAGVLAAITAAVGLTNVYFSRKNLEHNQKSLDQQRSLEAQRSYDAALQTYFDQMKDLLTGHDLRNSEVNADVRLLAEAQTVTVINTIDPARKARLVLFLERAQLINEDNPIIVLVWADLRHVDLNNQVLMETDFSGANLSHANLKGADMTRSNLSGDLIGADLRGATLRYAYLGYANLTDAKLADADLTRADLSNAKGITDAELRRCRSLEGATMPNGQKYEDWLKSGKDDGEGG
jgi:uncharacterized protein YjbI with pentapeptide repeats